MEDKLRRDESSRLERQDRPRGLDGTHVLIAPMELAVPRVESRGLRGVTDVVEGKAQGLIRVGWHGCWLHVAHRAGRGIVLGIERAREHLT